MIVLRYLILETDINIAQNKFTSEYLFWSAVNFGKIITVGGNRGMKKRITKGVRDGEFTKTDEIFVLYDTINSIVNKTQADQFDKLVTCLQAYSEQGYSFYLPCFCSFELMLLYMDFVYILFTNRGNVLSESEVEVKEAIRGSKSDVIELNNVCSKVHNYDPDLTAEKNYSGWLSYLVGNKGFTVKKGCLGDCWTKTCWYMDYCNHECTGTSFKDSDWLHKYTTILRELEVTNLKDLFVKIG